jgi:hypothetical protein
MAKSKYKEKESDRPARPTPKNDAYVVMICITFFAILIGCVLMYLDNDQYGSKQVPKEPIPALTDLGGKGGGEPK